MTKTTAFDERLQEAFDALGSLEMRTDPAILALLPIIRRILDALDNVEGHIDSRIEWDLYT